MTKNSIIGVAQSPDLPPENTYAIGVALAVAGYEETQRVSGEQVMVYSSTSEPRQYLSSKLGNSMRLN